MHPTVHNGNKRPLCIAGLSKIIDGVDRADICLRRIPIEKDLHEAPTSHRFVMQRLVTLIKTITCKHRIPTPPPFHGTRLHPCDLKQDTKHLDETQVDATA